MASRGLGCVKFGSLKGTLSLKYSRINTAQLSIDSIWHEGSVQINGKLSLKYSPPPHTVKTTEGLEIMDQEQKKKDSKLTANTYVKYLKILTYCTQRVKCNT